MNRREFLALAGTGALAGFAGYLSMCNGEANPKKSLIRKPEIQSEALFVRNPEYSFDWMKRFPYNWVDHAAPVEKFDLLFEQLSKEFPASSFIASNPLSRKDYLRVHTRDQLDRLEDLASSWRGIRTFFTENPINDKILNFVKASCSGTYQAADIALKTGKAMNLSGGFHHAFPDHEEGFCHLNDVAITIKKLQAEKKIKKAMVVDCDVHHGNGTAYIFQNDPSVFTFDFYQSNTYPDKKIKVDERIALSSHRVVDDNLYLRYLKYRFASALDRAKPDVLIYLNGADPFIDDKLGGFLLTHDGLKKRDEHILQTAHKKGVPVVAVLSGGYSKVEDVVKVHYNCAKTIAKL